MAGKSSFRSLFGLENSNSGMQFVNFYSDENSILNVNEKCYFLFTNVIDIHRPLIGEGTVIEDEFIDGLNKIYYIQLDEIHDNQKAIEQFMYNNNLFMLHSWEKGKVGGQGMLRKITGKNNNADYFSRKLFRIESFMVRKTFNQIRDLRQEYLQIIKEDLVKQIKEIDLCIQ